MILKELHARKGGAGHLAGDLGAAHEVCRRREKAAPRGRHETMAWVSEARHRVGEPSSQQTMAWRGQTMAWPHIAGPWYMVNGAPDGGWPMRGIGARGG